MKHHTFLACAFCAFVSVAPMARADGGHALSQDAEIGRAGNAALVTRDIAISMEEMRFTPNHLSIHAGETIRFTITNDGRAVHEFNIGTADMWNGHRAEMREMMQAGMMTMRAIDRDRMNAAGMMHDDPNSLLLAPGETGEIIWTFPDEIEMGFACNLPGHFEAGMRGSVDFMH